MLSRFLTFSHPLYIKRVRTIRQAEGKYPPSLGSGGTSLTAIGLSVGLIEALEFKKGVGNEFTV